MKKTIETSHQLDAPIDKVWANVRTGAEWEKWLPILSGSKLEDNGNKRVCHTQEGGDIHETILKSDDKEKLFQYRIDQQSIMPIDSAIGTMKFRELNGKTHLSWNLEVEVENEESFEKVKPGVEEIYTISSQKLAELSNN